MVNRRFSCSESHKDETGSAQITHRKSQKPNKSAVSKKGSSLIKRAKKSEQPGSKIHPELNMKSRRQEKHKDRKFGTGSSAATQTTEQHHTSGGNEPHTSRNPMMQETRGGRRARRHRPGNPTGGHRGEHHTTGGGGGAREEGGRGGKGREGREGGGPQDVGPGDVEEVGGGGTHRMKRTTAAAEMGMDLLRSRRPV